jgi:hypothetical protein
MTQKFSSELETWARQAKFELTPSADSTGAAIFWSAPGGETRFHIREGDDGWTTLQRSERGGPKQFVLATSTIASMERYLWGLFGVDVRSMRGLPRIDTPSEISDLAPGYTLRELDAENQRTLLDAAGEAVALARERRLSLWTLVERSHLLSASVENIKLSYENPPGEPLFHL